jgi:hypothetical protein
VELTSVRFSLPNFLFFTVLYRKEKLLVLPVNVNTYCEFVRFEVAELTRPRLPCDRVLHDFICISTVSSLYWYTSCNRLILFIFVLKKLHGDC